MEIARGKSREADDGMLAVELYQEFTEKPRPDVHVEIARP